jgi:predicted DsbA family dithiol-disulfide isomerase
VREFLDSDAGIETTLGEIAGAFDVGVVGVPCYRLGGAFLLPGAQTPDVMIQFIDRARKRLPETD